jgi:EAL domain-containing protein (putative c-di-GMP-specific phosphodiesterase class I)
MFLFLEIDNLTTLNFLEKFFFVQKEFKNVYRIEIKDWKRDLEILTRLKDTKGVKYYNGTSFKSLNEFLVEKLLELLSNLPPPKYQMIFSKDKEPIGAEFFCNFPVTPDTVLKILEDNSYKADIACFKNIANCVKRSGWNKLIFYNVYTSSFNNLNFVRKLVSQIFHYGLNAQVVVEVLEQKLINKSSVFVLKRNGIKLALDDWGSEYAGLARLVELKPHFVKMDKSITWNPEALEIALPLIKKIVEKYHVVMEGVETEEHFEFLTKECPDCFFQGFYLHRPEPFKC